MNIFNTYSKLPEIFYHKNDPRTPSNPKVLDYNEKLGEFLGLNYTESEIKKYFSGQEVDKEFDPISTVYSGHQFGHFNPQLGDGRAHLLGEVKAKDQKLYDIQLKGSGTSRYSRRGDGLCPLGPAVREYIVSEAMAQLNVPTTRSLALISTGDKVYRDEELDGAILTRVAQGHIRIGTFEYFIARGDEENLKILADYCIERFYPEVLSSQLKYYKFFEAISQKQIELVAKWMGLGFIHGVMNTDNTSILGLTIDYGPCAFMDTFQKDKVFSSIDQNSRYAYNNQMDVVLWNLSILARSLFPLFLDEMENKNEENLIKKLEMKFESLKENSSLAIENVFAKKFGFVKSSKRFSKFYHEFLEFLETEKLDFTQAFINLENSNFPNTDLVEEWRDILNLEKISIEKANERMKNVNPCIIPRNHLIQKSIEQMYEGKDSFFRELQQALKKPFNREFIDSKFYYSPNPDEMVYQTFCGT